MNRNSAYFLNDETHRRRSSVSPSLASQNASHNAKSQGMGSIHAAPKHSASLNSTRSPHDNNDGAAQTRRIHTHHFPLYSHPMFRAAIHNSDAVRGAMAAQINQVDPTALDDALDRMVDELLRQQQQGNGVEGSPSGGMDLCSNSDRGPVVSEEQLLALLAAVSETPAASTSPSPKSAPPSGSAPSATPQRTQTVQNGSSLSSLSSPPPAAVKPKPTTTSTAAFTATTTATTPQDMFVSTNSLLCRPLPVATRHAAAAAAAANPTSSQKALEASSLPDDDVHVVSVNTLLQQSAAATHNNRNQNGFASEHDRKPSVDASFASPYASMIPLGRTALTHSPSGPSVLQPSLYSPQQQHQTQQQRRPYSDEVSSSSLPKPKAETTPCPRPVVRFSESTGPTSTAARSPGGPRQTNLYSLLPLTTTTTSTTAHASLSPPLLPSRVTATSTSAGGALSKGTITFADMDRRPGVSTGPVAQQSVDDRQLQGVSDAVFAAMDVLMDGNSCCVRRRQRGHASTLSRSAPTFSTPSSTHNKMHYGGGMFDAAVSQPSIYNSNALRPPPPPPLPRTAAEAKARRILEAQRHRQQQHQQQQSRHTPLYAAAGVSGNTPRAAVSRSSSQWSAADLHEGGRSISLPPVHTTRGLASTSLFAQAVTSAQHFNPPAT